MTESQLNDTTLPKEKANNMNKELAAKTFNVEKALDFNHLLNQNYPHKQDKFQKNQKTSFIYGISYLD